MSEQLTLKYEEIEKVANRSYLRENFKRGNRETYHIPEEMILEREGFNNRIVYVGLDELKDSLIANGLLDPLVVDVLPDGRVFVDEGYRRIRAIRAAKVGRPDLFHTVECYVNGSDVTELERKIRITTSNQCRELLKPIERANNAYEVKYCFGSEKTNEEVAKLLGISRQTVDNLIKIATAPDATKNEILLADMSITEAIKYLSAQKKGKKEAEKAEEDANKNGAGKTPLPHDINADELKQLEALGEPGTGTDDLPFSQVDEDTGEIRIVNPELKEFESKGLDLIGNTVASTGAEAKEKDDQIKYNEDRPEIAQIQNCIKLNDRLGVRIDKLQISDGDKKDLLDWLKWQMKDLEEARAWIHSNKKQNKAR